MTQTLYRGAVALGILALFVFLASTGIALADGATLNGGGHILEGDGHGKHANVKDISFGTEVYDIDGIYEGNLDIVLHNVGNDEFDKGRFHGTDITSVNLFPSDSDTCVAAMNMTVNGTFNGEVGWKVIFRAGDSGEPASKGSDTVRVSLYQGNTLVYDTHGGDFSNESSCVGSARTDLDKGNLTITL